MLRRLLVAITLASLSSGAAGHTTQRASTSAPVGAIQGAFDVTASGSATYVIPIDVTPGRMGMQPRLSLVYDSHAGDGIMGRGWRLEGLSSIRRCSKSVAQHGVRDGVSLTAADAFCLDEQPLVVSQTQACPQGREFRTHNAPFDRICALEPGKPGVPASFRVFRRDGTIAEYADDLVGVVQTDTAVVRAVWPIRRLADRRGNDVIFKYRTADGWNQEVGDALDGVRDPGFSVESIHYTGHATLGPARAIRFRYEKRPDPITGFFHATVLKAAYRLAAIDVEGPDARPVHRYLLTYEARGSLQPLSRLVAVTQCDGEGACLPPTTFEWSPEQSLRYNSPRGDGPVKALDLQDFTRYHVPILANVLGSGTGQLLAKRRFTVGWMWQILTTDGNGQLSMAPSFQWPGTIEKLLFADLDGDGRQEIIKLKRGDDPLRTWEYIVLRALPRSNAPTLAKGSLGYFGYFDHLSTGDFDGDGDQEFLARFKSGGGSNYAYFLIHAPPDLKSLRMTPIGVTHAGRTEIPMVLDADGDGRDELLFKDFRDYLLLEQPAAGPWTLRRQAVEQSASTFWIPRYGTVLDANGDGYDDVLVPDTNYRLGLWLNDGTRFVRGAAIDLTGPTLSVFANGGDLAPDLDGDGREELLLLRRTASGQEIVTAIFWNGTGLSMRDLDLRLANGRRPELRGGYEVLVMADLTDDGAHEIMDSQRRMFVREGGRAGVITAIRSGLHHGRDPEDLPPDVRIEYAWASKPSLYASGQFSECGAEQICGTPPFYLVNRIELGLGRTAGSKAVEFTYRDARFDRRGRGFLGFRERVESEPATGLVRTTTFDNATFVRALHAYPYAGRAKSVTVRADTSAGLLTRSVDSSFQHRLLNGGRSIFSFTVARVEVEKRPAAAGALETISEVLQTMNVDDFGNVVRRERVWRTNPDHVLRSIPKTPWLAELLSLERAGPYERVDRTYSNDQNTWLIGLLTSEETWSRSAVCEVAAPRSGRPPQGVTLPPWYKGPGCPEGGEVRTIKRLSYRTEEGQQDLVERIELNPHHPTARLTTTYGYDTFGNVTEQSDSGATDEAGTIQSRTFKTSFDPREHSFPVRQVNAKGHVVARSYDDRRGIELVSDGPSGRYARTIDGFGRLTRATRAGHDRVDVDLQRGTGTTAFVVNTSTARGLKRAVHVDMLGRPARMETLGFEGTATSTPRLVHRQFEYDEDGQLVSEELPRYADEESDAIERQFDAFGRRTQEFGRQGRFHFEYDGLVMRVTDPREEVTVYVRNAAGQTIAVIDPAGSPNRSYYGASGQLWRFYDAASNLYAREYDGLGRRVAVEHPDYGPRRLRYNAFGEVIRSTDAAGRVARFTFDELGRLTKRVDVASAGGADGETTFEWDPATGLGEGRLASTRSPDGTTERFTYDEFGRLQQMTLAGPSAGGSSSPSLTFAFAYDAAGRVQRIDYPSVGTPQPVSVTYEYDSASGLLKRISDRDTKVIWEAIRYQPSGQISVEMYGNGVRTDTSYWRRSGLVHQIASSRAGASPYQTALFAYWAGGNLFERTNRWSSAAGAVNTHDIADYDPVGRLQTVEDHLTQKTSLTMRYDAVGRITSKSDVGAYTYGGPRPHAVARAGSTVFTYNANGGVAARGATTFTYNAAGRLASATSPDGDIRFNYTARKQRLSKDTAASRTTYFGRLFAMQLTPAGPPGVRQAIFRVPGPGARFVAELTAASPSGGPLSTVTPRYLSYDHLGSISAATDEAGNVAYRWGYDAFGRRAVVEGGACAGCELGFTGHVHDDELGLVDAGARHYDPAVGQFLTPDPLVGSPWSTQSLNPYAYVYNNPLSLRDPTGRQAESTEYDFPADETLTPQFASDKEVMANFAEVDGVLDFDALRKPGESSSLAQGDSKLRWQQGGTADTPGLGSGDPRTRKVKRGVFDPGRAMRRPGAACASCNWGRPTGPRTRLPKLSAADDIRLGTLAEATSGTPLGEVLGPLDTAVDVWQFAVDYGEGNVQGMVGSGGELAFGGAAMLGVPWTGWLGVAWGAGYEVGTLIEPHVELGGIREHFALGHEDIFWEENQFVVELRSPPEVSVGGKIMEPAYQPYIVTRWVRRNR